MADQEYTYTPMAARNKQAGQVASPQPEVGTLRNLGAFAARTLGPYAGMLIGGGLGAVAGSETGPGAIGTAIMGGRLGSAAGGAAGESLAEWLEGRPQSVPRIAVSGALGAVPGSWIVKEGKPGLSALYGAGMGLGSSAAYKVADSGPEGLKHWNANDALGIAAGAGFGALGGKMSKAAKAKGAGEPPPPSTPPDGGIPPEGPTPPPSYGKVIDVNRPEPPPQAAPAAKAKPPRKFRPATPSEVKVMEKNAEPFLQEHAQRIRVEKAREAAVKENDAFDKARGANPNAIEAELIEKKPFLDLIDEAGKRDLTPQEQAILDAEVKKYPKGVVAQKLGAKPAQNTVQAAEKAQGQANDMVGKEKKAEAKTENDFYKQVEKDTDAETARILAEREAEKKAALEAQKKAQNEANLAEIEARKAGRTTVEGNPKETTSATTPGGKKVSVTDTSVVPDDEAGAAGGEGGPAPKPKAQATRIMELQKLYKIPYNIATKLAQQEAEAIAAGKEFKLPEPAKGKAPVASPPTTVEAPAGAPAPEAPATNTKIQVQNEVPSTANENAPKPSGLRTKKTLEDMRLSQGASQVKEPAVTVKAPKGKAIPVAKTPEEAAAQGLNPETGMRLPNKVSSTFEPGATSQPEGVVLEKTPEGWDRTKFPAEAPPPEAPQDITTRLRAALDAINKKGGSQKGEIDPMLLARLTTGGIGAGIGAATDKEDRLRGALIGGTAGAFLPSAFKRPNIDPEGMTNAMSAIGERLPNYVRGSMLSDPISLFHNMALGPWGSNFFGGLEEMAQGNPEGKQAVASALNIPKWSKQFFKNIPEAGDIISESERANMTHIDDPNILDKAANLPAKLMTAGDITARDNLIAAGIPEEMARKYTNTAEPTIPSVKGIVNFGKERDEFGNGPLWLQLMLPFKRTGANILENGLERTPIAGEILNAWRKAKQPGYDLAPATRMAQQGIGTGVMGAAYLAGLMTSDDADKTYRIHKLVSNIAGPYALPAGVAFAMGRAAAKGKSQIGAGGTEFGQSFPVPSTDVITESAKPFRSLSEGKPLSPSDYVPDYMIPKIIPALGGGAVDAIKYFSK